MQYWRCKCGKEECWESGFPPANCVGCDECKTTLGLNPDMHKPLEPHDLELRYDEKTGKPSYQRCKKCYQRFPLEGGE